MLLLRGATLTDAEVESLYQSFNTCSSCEEQHGLGKWRRRCRLVSIHAPLARSNCRSWRRVRTLTCFNTCSSCEEQLFDICLYLFRACFNTCSSCEEQPVFCEDGLEFRGFNTCSSCEEQHSQCSELCPTDRFNTCSSCEEQLSSRSFSVVVSSVSIHAPLARSNV